MSAVKVLIVEDEEMFRNALSSQLSDYSEIEVVGDASDGLEAVEKADRLGPDVVLMDIQLAGGMNGIQAANQIRSSSPTTGVVLLSMHKDRQFLDATIVDEPSGWSYLLKKNVREANVLVRAILGSSWGLVVVDPELADELKPREDTPLDGLTDEQINVLGLVAQGYTDAAIAENLQLPDETFAKELLKSIYLALGIKSNGDVNPRVKAVVSFLEQSRTAQATTGH